MLRNNDHFHLPTTVSILTTNCTSHAHHLQYLIDLMTFISAPSTPTTTRAAVAFENPMYGDAEGYAPESAGGDSSGGYMDVQGGDADDV